MNLIGFAVASDPIKLSYDQFFRDAFQAWSAGRLFKVPEFIRRDPLLDAAAPSNLAVFYVQTEREFHAQRLAARTTQAMDKVTVPLVRHATVMDMTFNGRKLGRWTRRVALYTEDEIAHAVKAVRLQLESRSARLLRPSAINADAAEACCLPVERTPS